MKMCVIMNLKGEEKVKKKIILFTTLLVIGGSAGIYTAESEQAKQKQIQQLEVKKAKEAEEKKSMEKAADKLGVSTEGKTKEEVAKEVNTARFEKRHDLLSYRQDRKKESGFGGRQLRRGRVSCPGAGQRGGRTARRGARDHPVHRDECDRKRCKPVRLCHRAAAGLL